MKKIFTAIFVIATLLGAIAVGWIYESRLNTAIAEPDLEIPTDIDYFLAEVKYQTYNETGALDTQLNSPYMEHFPLEDISRVKQPVVNVFRDSGDWRIQALSGDFLHQQNQYFLRKSVVIKRLGENPMQVRSESILIEPERDLISSNTEVIIELGGARISGDTAVFDLRNQVYSMKNTRAIYNNGS